MRVRPSKLLVRILAKLCWGKHRTENTAAGSPEVQKHVRKAKSVVLVMDRLFRQIMLNLCQRQAEFRIAFRFVLYLATAYTQQTRQIVKLDHKSPWPVSTYEHPQPLSQPDRIIIFWIRRFAMGGEYPSHAECDEVDHCASTGLP